MTAVGSPSDPVSVLREYRHLAPWNVRDLVAVAGAILQAAGITPINAAATARPSERTVRFYVTRGLMAPPDGRGTAANYGYRHLLEILRIKLRQMEGATLKQIEEDMEQMTGDVLERRVAAVLGPGVPVPSELDLSHRRQPTAGRSGRVLNASSPSFDLTGASDTGTTWRRIPVTQGIELHVHDAHPLARLSQQETEVAEVVRAAIAGLIGGRGNSDPAGGDPGQPASAEDPEA